jgi:transposase
MLLLKKLVWQYEQETTSQTRLKQHVRQLSREHTMSSDPQEKALIAQIMREKRQEVERKSHKQKRLAEKFRDLLTGHEDNLTSIPGIAIVLAAKISAHSDDMTRFATIAKYLQFAGIAPLEKSSGKTKRAIQNHKGNRSLNNTFYMVAVSQITHNPPAKAYYQKKIAEGKTKKHALRCVMKRIAMIVYGMLRYASDGQAV